MWPLQGRAAVVWGAAGAVGRILVAILADRGVDVIGIARREHVDSVQAAGASRTIDRTTENIVDAVLAHTHGEGVAAVFDPIGAPTFDTSLRLLAPRGCLINYGELLGSLPAIDIHELFSRSLFVTKYNGTRWVGRDEFAGLIAQGLAIAAKRRAIIGDVAGRFTLDEVVAAYRMLESKPEGKVLVLPDKS